MDIRAPDQQYNPYRIFTREQWARLRDDTPMTLEPGEFDRLRSMHDRLDIKEVEDIYLPLSRLLSIYVDAMQRLYYSQRQFLGIRDRKMPYTIGIAGSVAGGKSTTARVLQALPILSISNSPFRPKKHCSKHASSMFAHPMPASIEVRLPPSTMRVRR